MKAYRGFTLIELLVAVSLATIITLLGVSLMRTSINSSVTNEEALKQHQAIRDARRLIEYAWSGRQKNGFSVKQGQLEFRSSQQPLGTFPLRFVCQAGDKEDYALWLYKVSPPATTGQSGEPANELSGEMLLGTLKFCKFSFLQGPQGDKPSPRWNDDWPVGQEPPAVIRLDLAMLQGTLPPFIFAVGGP